MKVYTSLWVTSVVLLMLDTRTGAGPLHPEGVQPHRCYSCSVANGSSCDFPPPSTEQGTSPPPMLHGESIMVCPPEKPYCATLAKSPDFLSTLTCSVGSSTTCTLTINGEDLQFNCSCDKDFCSKPFSESMRQNLISKNTPVFREQLKNHQIELNQMRSKLLDNNKENATTIVPGEEVKGPIAEALKQEATVPSDDEEDDVEGSGSYDETKMSRRPANPAAPSSFLPAEENQASHLTNSLLITLLFLYAAI